MTVGDSRLWRRLLLGLALLALGLAGDPARPVRAQGQQPPLPSGPVAQPAMAPAQPAASQSVLFDQMDAAGSDWVSSQDFSGDQNDAKAADDFFVDPGFNSWQISAVQVAGAYFAGGVAAVDGVNVEFYLDSGGLPGYLLTARVAQPISGTGSTGAFFLPLTPTVNIASNANYWISVQAIKPSAGQWTWTESTALHGNGAVWQNPGDGFTTGCVSWSLMTTCLPGTGPDLLFRLYGTKSASQVAPILVSLDPNHAANRPFTLTAVGAGFANGAVLDWTLGATQHFSTTVSSSARLTSPISAAAVASYGAAVTVTVTNPGPCGGSCTSNALIFTVKNLMFLPVVRR